MRFSCWACDTLVLPSLLKRFVMASCWQALTNSFRGHAGSQGSFKETDMEEDQAPCCDLGARLQTHPAGLQRIALAQARPCTHAGIHTHPHTTDEWSRPLGWTRCSAAFLHGHSPTRTRRAAQELVILKVIWGFTQACSSLRAAGSQQRTNWYTGRSVGAQLHSKWLKVCPCYS